MVDPSSFPTNKYTRWYFQIIDRARVRGWTKKSAECYVERHHIIPKCASFGGSNQADNLVYLTAKEHFVCHRLLVRMTTNHNQRNAMLLALHRLIHGQAKNHCRITARTYVVLKEQLSLIVSARFKGRKQTEQHRLRRAAAMVGKNCGKHRTEEWKRQRSLQMQGNQNLLGYKRSETTKAIQSTKMKGRLWWNNGKGVHCRSKCCPGEGWKHGRTNIGC